MKTDDDDDDNDDGHTWTVHSVFQTLHIRTHLVFILILQGGAFYR